MQTLAQELSSLARRASEKNEYIKKTTDNLYHATIRNIKAHRCVWNNMFSSVTVIVPEIALHEPIIEYDDMSHYFNKDCETQLTEKFTKDGFKLVSISVDGRLVSHIVLEVLNCINP